MAVHVARLLWIDDDETLTSVMSRVLAQRGFDVDCAQSVTHGFSMAVEQCYDAIVLDLRLPDGSGLGLLDMLRERGIATPIALLTGYATVRSAMVAGQLGASRFLEKPVSVQDFCAAMHDLITASSIAEGNVIERLLQRLRALVAMMSPRGLPVPDLLQSDLDNLDAAVGHPHTKVGGAIAALEAELIAGRRPKLEAVADLVGIERSHLGRVLQAHTGIGYRDWRRLLAMAFAGHLLLETDESVSQIAYKIGFEHHSRFDVEFVTTFGVSPKDFRRCRSHSRSNSPA